MQRNIYAIGETVYDIIFRNQQPVAARAGGSTLNSVISMGKAGLPVHFISEFACDDIGNNIDNFLNTNGVATDYIYRFSDGKTSVSIAMLDEKNNASYSFYKQLPQKRLNIQLPTVTANDIVLYGSFFAISKEVRDKVQPWLKQAREAGAIMIYDPNFRKAHLHELNEMYPMILENMSLASIVRGSDEDFQMIFNCILLQDTYQKVLQYCPNLIVTANAAGIDLVTPDIKLHHDVKQLQPVSTIGAGDNFNAGLITALFKTEVKHNSIATLKAEDWTKLLSSGAAFSADVCMSYDNYISDLFAKSIC
jgi:fructokinase